MQEMIKALINAGFNWVTKNSGGTEVFQNKPSLDKENNNFYDEEHWGLSNEIPSCLFPGVTFENSPVELKTLLVDNEEEEQKVLRNWIEEHQCHNGYLVRNWKGCVLWIPDTENEFKEAKELEMFVPNKYEKVYLKDLIKKRKVKKRLWFAVNKDGTTSFFDVKPERCKFDTWTVPASRGYVDINCLFTVKMRVFGLSWEDEPIELFCEVEE